MSKIQWLILVAGLSMLAFGAWPDTQPASPDKSGKNIEMKCPPGWRPDGYGNCVPKDG
jgi:hypothetical protein